MSEITWASEKRRLGDLTEWPKNPRQINKEQADRLNQSLVEFGQVQAICIDPDNMIVDGHQRKAVWGMADEFGMDYVVDVRVANRKLSDDEQKKLTVYLQKASGEWDFDVLASEFDIDELIDWGFDEGELDLDLWPSDEPPEDPGADVDRAEELREKWGVESGQLWQLGAHRLICGDCTDAAVVERVMDGEKADMVFTDPPYNVASDSGNFAADVSKSMMALSEAEWDKGFDPADALEVLLGILADDVSVYVCASHFLAPKIWGWMAMWAAHHEWCAWHKTNPMPSLSKRHWTWDGELIPYATRGSHVFNFPATGHAPSIWDIPKEKKTGHPTEKPVSVPEMAIRHSSNKGQVVFDPFLGSGTTLIACERLGRKGRAVEISPAYVAVAIERWSEMTGEEPVLIEAD